jgi:hypothetical protein
MSALSGTTRGATSTGFVDVECASSHEVFPKGALMKGLGHRLLRVWTIADGLYPRSVGAAAEISRGNTVGVSVLGGVTYNTALQLAGCAGS